MAEPISLAHGFGWADICILDVVWIPLGEGAILGRGRGRPIVGGGKTAGSTEMSFGM